MARYDDDDDDDDEKLKDDEDEASADVVSAPSSDDDDDDEGSRGDDDGGGVPSVPPAASGSPVNKEELAAWLSSKYGDQTQTPAAQVAALQDGYGQAADNSGVKAAQDDARFGNNVANFGRALESLARSNSMAHGGEGVDDKFYQGIAAQGAQGVGFAQANRQAKIQQFLQENALKQQVAQSMMLRGSIEDKKKAQAWLQDYDNRKLALMEKDNALKFKTMQDVADTRADSVADRIADRKQTASDREADRQLVRDKISGEKDDQKKAKNYADLIKQAEGARGAPQPVIKSMNAQVAINNAQKLIAEFPDLNKMPDAKVQLLNAELEKVASNGAGTEAGRQGLNPNTFKQGFDKFMGRVGNQPTGAELGEFIQQNADYLKGLKEVSNNTINKYRQNIFAGNKKLIAPDDAEDFKQRYAEAFGQPAPPAVAPVSPSKSDLEAEMKRRGLLK